jgi:hypothetical protein
MKTFQGGWNFLISTCDWKILTKLQESHKFNLKGCIRLKAKIRKIKIQKLFKTSQSAPPRCLS